MPVATMPDSGSASATSANITATVREAIRPGSPRHLAVLFSGSPQRSLLEAVYAFEAELRRIVASESHEAAHARLQWWRGELDRLDAGRPSHPLAVALLPLRGRRDADLGLLHELLVAADLDLSRLTYLSWQELEAYLFRATGAAQTLIAAVLAGDRPLTPAEREFARRLGVALRQSEILIDIERDARRGRLYAPLQALEAAGIDPATFAARPLDPAHLPFLADWQARVGRELAALPEALDSKALRAAQRHGLVLATLQAKWLERRPVQAARRLTSSEPGSFAHVWTAWRTALRHA
jgi:phytoene synthase